MSHRRPLRRFRAARLALVAGLFAVATTSALAQPTSIGLSAVRAQRFGNENLLGFYTPQAGDSFASTLAAGDFNGDGADDLATGMPLDNGLAGNPVVDSGTVIVRYATPGAGLNGGLASTVLRQSAARDPAEEGDNYGSALAACDFNGDAIDDLAVGVPNENYAGKYDAGAVEVHYGTSSGLPTASDAFYTESTAGIPGDVEEHDRFGRELDCGDFDADGFDDLAIGIPDESWGPPLSYHAGMGMVVIIPGSLVGLVPAQATSLDQDSPGMNGGADSSDFFGEALAAGDFDGDGFDDLAIGVPNEDVEGSVQVVFGSPRGLTADGNLFWSETFIGGQSETGDYFAGELEAGDFDADGFDDLAIGIPFEDPDGTSIDAAGAFAVLYGAADGFDRTRTRFFDQDNVLGAGTSETTDYFGYRLAAADFDRDGFDDLAVGAYLEFVSGAKDGALTVLMGGAAGLSAARHRGIAAGYEGFPGVATVHDKLFSAALTQGDFDGDGHADLAVGAPYEDVSGIANVGSEAVLYGALFADGVETGNSGLWSQTVSSLYFNRINVTGAARLGPLNSTRGLQVDLVAPTLTRPGNATYVRVGPEAGFHDERTLRGTFFIDPQGLTMSSATNFNSFQLLACNDTLGAGARNRLAFDLVRTATTWSIVGNYFDELTNALTFAGSGVIANAGDQSARNNRIEFEWRGGNPGHLTVWRTRFVNGVPDTRVELFSVDLPHTQGAAINHVLAGMVTGHDSGTYGPLYLDELSFRR